ncbi:MAG: glycosyltransferase, partial [bacterium]|nr:glycosyltransferase [bacterium]
MNVLLVSDTYEPQINGLVTSLNIHRDALRKKGVRVYLLVPRLKAYPDHDILTLPSLPLLRLNKYRIPVPFSWKNLARIKEIKIDLIHTHTPFSLGVYALF